MAMSLEPPLLKKKLKSIFGFDDFMSSDQEQATQEVFKGNSDVYINLQPGGGKSICFQLPAVLNEHKLTVVFVPTNCLGKDQVDSLQKRNIKAEFLYPGTRKNVRKAIFNKLKPDNVQLNFLYASVDEKTRNLVNDLMIKLSARNSISFIIFDEAHCVSQLSHDYIPNYREVAKLFQLSHPNIRKIALTGTATRQVRHDIIHELGMREPKKCYTTYQWLVQHEVYFLDTMPKPYEDLKRLIEENVGSLTEPCSEDPPKFGIIFCRKKAAVKGVTNKLRALKVPVVSYHGDLSWKERNAIHEKWIAGKIRVIATTRNFTLGLHRKNVRLIVHWSMPMSIQQLFQDTGKGTQDEKKTLCRVYSSFEEEDDILRFIKSLPNVPGDNIDIISQKYQFFQEVIKYCLGTKCRNATLLGYFGKTDPSCNLCDACCNLKNLRKRIDQNIQRRLVMKTIRDIDLHHKQINDSNKHKNVIDVQGYLPNTELTPRVRQRSYMRLHEELMNTYEKAQPDIKKMVKVEDIPEIARQLEYSLCKAAPFRRKYNHDIVQAVRVIRDSCNSSTACSYLKFYQPEEKSIYVHKPEVVDLADDENEDEQMEFHISPMRIKKTFTSELKSTFGNLQLHQVEETPINNTKLGVIHFADNENEDERMDTETNIEIVDLVDDSDSETE